MDTLEDIQITYAYHHLRHLDEYIDSINDGFYGVVNDFLSMSPNLVDTFTILSIAMDVMCPENLILKLLYRVIDLGNETVVDFFDIFISVLETGYFETACVVIENIEWSDESLSNIQRSVCEYGYNYNMRDILESLLVYHGDRIKKPIPFMNIESDIITDFIIRKDPSTALYKSFMYDSEHILDRFIHWVRNEWDGTPHHLKYTIIDLKMLKRFLKECPFKYLVYMTCNEEILGQYIKKVIEERRQIADAWTKSLWKKSSLNSDLVKIIHSFI